MGRREFLRATGAAGVGLLLAGWSLPQRIRALQGPVVEIGMYTVGADMFFDPVGIAVEPGTTIHFVLESGQHTATTYHPDYGKPLRIPQRAESWDSGVLVTAGDVFAVTLTEEGVYDYYCVPHEFLGMVGRIVVGDPAKAPAQPLEELQFPSAREALPDVERILRQRVVRF